MTSRNSNLSRAFETANSPGPSSSPTNPTRQSTPLPNRRRESMSPAPSTPVVFQPSTHNHNLEPAPQYTTPSNSFNDDRELGVPVPESPYLKRAIELLCAKMNLGIGGLDSMTKLLHPSIIQTVFETDGSIEVVNGGPEEVLKWWEDAKSVRSLDYKFVYSIAQYNIVWLFCKTSVLDGEIERDTDGESQTEVGDPKIWTDFCFQFDKDLKVVDIKMYVKQN